MTFTSNVLSLKEQLSQYLDKRRFNSDIADIVLSMICNALKAKVHILDMNSEGTRFTVLEQSPIQGNVSYDVCLLRRGTNDTSKHYDALILKKLSSDSYNASVGDESTQSFANSSVITNSTSEILKAQRVNFFSYLRK
jgi:hypothetical protein